MIHVDETDPVGEIEPAFPYKDVSVRRGNNFTVNYDLELELGRGKFGTVYLCKDKRNGLKLAAKIVNISKKEDRRAVEREVEIMRRLQHPRLIQLYDALDAGKQFYVVLELIEGGELFERVIDDDFVLTERSCAVFMRQICEGIEFVHSQNILHLDLKPENILCLTKEGNRIKVIDFGLARLYDPKKKLQVLFGTPEFVAPEVVNFDEIGFGTDMWSIGVICYVLLSGLSPFMGDTDIETMANVTIAKYDFDHEAFTNISDDAKDFIRCLLVKDKEKRSTAGQCRMHPWLKRKTVQSTENTFNKEMEQAKETTSSNSGKNTVKLTSTKTKAKNNKKQSSHLDDKLLLPTTSAKLYNELDVTKDNLKVFVERWRDHPNSPYTVETSTDLDSLATARSSHQVNGSNSLRGQSPSPPESITSEISESLSPLDPSHHDNNKLSFLDVVHFSCLDRRASEGFATRPNPGSRDPLSQIMLAEEIIKLSEHLRSSICIKSNSPSSSTSRADKNDSNALKSPIPVVPSVVVEKTRNVLNNNNHNNIARESSNVNITEETNERIVKFQGNENNNSSNNEVNEITEKLMSLTRDRKLNGTKFNGNKNYDNQSNGLNVGGFTLKKTSLTITETGNNLNSNKSVDLTPPWRRLRVKRRFGETCRDVPRIDSLQNMHKDISLDEQTTSTKDLLLQLLDEWEEKPAFQLGARSKSISVDSSNGESIARKSINTLAEYFQSIQQQYSQQTACPNNDG